MQISKLHLTGIFWLLSVLTIHACTHKTEKQAIKYSETAIPLKIYNNLILIEGSIAGTKGYFVWDNGFTFTAINRNLEIDKTPAGDAPVIGKDPLGKDIRMDIYRITSLKFGGIEAGSPQITEIDTDRLFPCAEYTILGLIGANIINCFSWSFDFDNNRLEIRKTDFPIEDASAIHVDYLKDETSYVHYMPVSINDVDGFTLVDWGYTGTGLSVSENFSGLFSESQKKYTIEGNSFQTVNGTTQIPGQLVLDNHYMLKLGSYEVGGQFRPAVELAGESAADVVLGNYFFRANYNVIINSVSSRYVLQERTNKDLEDVPESVNYGITLKKSENGNLQIDGIIKEHPDVVSSKVKPAMAVSAVNGNKASDFKNQCELDEYIMSAKIKKENIVLELADGSKNTFNLIDMWKIYTQK